MDQAGVDKVLAQSRHELDSKTVSGPRGFGGPLGEGGCRRREILDSLSRGDSWMEFSECESCHALKVCQWSWGQREERKGLENHQSFSFES